MISLEDIQSELDVINIKLKISIEVFESIPNLPPDVRLKYEQLKKRLLETENIHTLQQRK